ncbi:MAG: tetratricopeptide repeat protein [Phycisphaerae bacterium]|nr:tetratricopeptide repeat protein [Phycisphaerae bacterium]
MFPTIRLVGPMLVLATLAHAQVEQSGPDTPSDPLRKSAGMTRKAPSSSSTQVRHPSDAHAALAAGDGRRALKLLNSRTLQLTPAERSSLEGRAHFLLGDHATARRKLESALRLRPKHAPDLYWLGRVYESAGMPALAASRFEEALWGGLDTADLHYHWAVVLKSLNQLLGDIAQRRCPKDAATPPLPGAFALGGLVVGPVPSRPGCVIVSPQNSAICQVHRSLELDPKRGDALLLCGQIWAAVNRHEQAVPAFAKAAELLKHDDLAKCHRDWAASLLTLGDFDAYLEHASEQLRLSGGGDSSGLARCYDRTAREVAQRGDLARQVRYLTTAVELEPKVNRLIALADALLQSQRANDAARYLRTALELDPTRRQRGQIQQRLRLTKYLAPPP